MISRTNNLTVFYRDSKSNCYFKKVTLAILQRGRGRRVGKKILATISIRKKQFPMRISLRSFKCPITTPQGCGHSECNVNPGEIQTLHLHSTASKSELRVQTCEMIKKYRTWFLRHLNFPC